MRFLSSINLNYQTAGQIGKVFLLCKPSWHSCATSGQLQHSFTAYNSIKVLTGKAYATASSTVRKRLRKDNHKKTSLSISTTEMSSSIYMLQYSLIFILGCALGKAYNFNTPMEVRNAFRSLFSAVT